MAETALRQMKRPRLEVRPSAKVLTDEITSLFDNKQSVSGEGVFSEYAHRYVSIENDPDYNNGVPFNFRAGSFLAMVSALMNGCKPIGNQRYLSNDSIALEDVEIDRHHVLFGKSDAYRAVLPEHVDRSIEALDQIAKSYEIRLESHLGTNPYELGPQG
ncbi:MAG: hypothetical protein V1740_06540 [Candidatus Woesearchaeota archaeon]